ncbi:MAG TPA: hypothetical protein VFL91_25030 [Thermomicrobiales bacterium]|nr:hypothetical protein [Thermomicrobiales bacterium]
MMRARVVWRLATALMLALGALGGALAAPRRAAAAPGQDATFVPETGHTLGGAFLAYWQQNGGLTRFGFPLSEPFTQVSPTDGKSYTTQYFERAVFEEHPENAGTPWEVELRLLGDDLARGRGGEAPFRPASAGNADAAYFPETGHGLDGVFLAYWQANGGLPVFGYPISEAFIETSPTDGKPYLVQYFERNRFEYHPEHAGTPYEVELGLLGRQDADARGLAGRGPFAALYQRNLALNWHRQMTDDWCDPADIQSWTEYLTGTRFPDDTAIQSRIWDFELSHNLGYTVDQWDASPYAMAAALHWLNPGRGFNHWIYDDPVEATKVMAYMLAAPGGGQPAIAVIRGGTHYILVTGVVADSDPYANYPNAHILGVYVSDPFIDYPGAAAKWLGKDGYLTLDEWLSIFTPNHWGVPGDPWQDKYVTVQADWQDMDPLPGGRHLADFHAHVGR